LFLFAPIGNKLSTTLGQWKYNRSTAAIAFCNKRAIYSQLFSANLRAMLTVVRVPRHFGTKIATNSALRPEDSATTHHPHILIELQKL